MRRNNDKPRKDSIKTALTIALMISAVTILYYDISCALLHKYGIALPGFGHAGTYISRQLNDTDIIIPNIIVLFVFVMYVILFPTTQHKKD